MLIGLTLLVVVSIIGSFVARNVYMSIQTKRAESLAAEMSKREAEIATYRDQEKAWVSLNTRLRLISAMLKHHVTLMPVFKFLEETVSPAVQYTSFNFTNDGTVGVNATSVSYEDMAKQVAALRADQDRVTQVDVSGITFDKGKSLVTFSLTIKLKPEVWQYGQF